MSRDTTYSALVRAYCDWHLTHDNAALRRIIEQRIAANKQRLMQYCGGMTADYTALLALAQRRGADAAAAQRS